MNDIEKRLGRTGVVLPEILLPGHANLGQWAVIACDQYTQDRSYWKKVQEAASGSPSSLNLIFPEIFLSDDDRSRRTRDIHRAMHTYLENGVFAPPRRGLVYLERDTRYNRGRRGLVAAIDLEQYDWSAESRSLIRATEDTVPERLPVRMDIRRNAPLETSHVFLLIDDETDTLLPALGERAKKKAPVYQDSLMLDSGSVSGWFLDSTDDYTFLADALDELARRSLTRYSIDGTENKPFLFAVGDGNHSLASARGIWQEGGGRRDAYRYALVEIVNIYDPAVTFEPIHRVLFGMSFESALRRLTVLPGFSSRILTEQEELARLVAEPVRGNRIGIISGGNYALAETSADGLSTAWLQPLLDEAIKHDASLSIDYIHGKDELFRLSMSGHDTPVCGFLLPPVHKDGFFKTIACNGPLPRKSFSMGEADEKRFYIECRSLDKKI